MPLGFSPPYLLRPASMPLSKQALQFGVKLNVKIVEGWQGPTGMEECRSRLPELLEKKALFEQMGNGAAYQYQFLQDDPQNDLSEQADIRDAFIEHYGQAFYEAILNKEAALTEGQGMAHLYYAPEENAVFILSTYNYDETRAAKITFGEQGQFLSIRQNGISGPFKNAGEYFRRFQVVPTA